MTDPRDRAINALCDTIADLRKRIADLEFAATIKTQPPQPAGSVVWRNVAAGMPQTVAEWIAANEGGSRTFPKAD
jgi:hypothetical protein